MRGSCSKANTGFGAAKRDALCIAWNELRAISNYQKDRRREVRGNLDWKKVEKDFCGGEIKLSQEFYAKYIAEMHSLLELRTSDMKLDAEVCDYVVNHVGASTLGELLRVGADFLCDIRDLDTILYSDSGFWLVLAILAHYAHTVPESGAYYIGICAPMLGKGAFMAGNTRKLSA